jgi:hypothetical protein
MEHLQAERILGVADVALDPFEQGADLAEIILRCNPSLEQNVDRLLAQVKILGPGSDQALDARDRPFGPRVAFGNPTEMDPRRAEAARRVSSSGDPIPTSGQRARVSRCPSSE